MNIKKQIRILVKTSFILILVLLNAKVFAQKEENVYKNAESAFYDESFGEAIILFNEVLAIRPGFKDSEYKLELCSLLLKENRERPLDFILDYGATKGKSDKFFNYWMGRVYVNRYMFPEAVDAWKAFLGRKAYKSKEIIEETKDFIKETEKLVAFFDNTDNYEVHQLELPINTQFAEMSPVYFEAKRELLYASSADSRNEIFKIYHSTRDGYEWTKPSEVTSLGQFERENANVEVVNEDGKLFLFNGKGGGSLYFSEPDAKGWKVPVEFDSKISSKNLASHFFINAHEDRIIFATKHKRDGLDLQESFKDAQTGKWSKPTALPASINTAWNEESPYLSPDEQTLYFSSERPGGVGGFDIYVSKFDNTNKTWGEPMNLGWPINSPDNDIHFKMNDDQESGYFISDRIFSKGDYDIFFFWQIEKAFVEGRVLNALTEEVVTSGEIRFHPSQYLVEYFRSEIDEKGRFRTEIISNEKFRVEIISGTDTLGVESYEIHDSKNETITHVQDFYALSKNATQEEIDAFNRKIAEIKYTSPEQPTEIASLTKPKSNPIKKIEEKPKASPVTETKKANPTVEELGSKYRSSNKTILDNVYFEFGTSTLTKESNEILNRLYDTLKNNSELKIEIGGHTDNVGAKDVNEWLSLNRAEAVKKWITKKGIDKDRIIAKGYGESKPIASNDDEINGRELNRRIEITVIE